MFRLLIVTFFLIITGLLDSFGSNVKVHNSNYQIALDFALEKNNAAHFFLFNSGNEILILPTIDSAFLHKQNALPLVKNLSYNTGHGILKKRVTAAFLALCLGPLGVHRLYLGCSPLVPAIYVATLGGALGLVPLIDFFVILFTKDLSQLEHNNRFFMWAK